MSFMDKYKVDIPEGTSGVWKVERFGVTASGAMLSSLPTCSNEVGRGVREGTYTRLTRNGTVVMSDTSAEILDHLHVIRLAHGRCLVAGLGLGMVVRAILLKDETEHVDVLELSEDVIKLVGPHLQQEFDDRLTIHQADAYQWKPPKGVRWNVAWYDIWDDLCTDNLKLMTKLHRKFGRRVDWQDSWGKDLLRRERERNKRQRW